MALTSERKQEIMQGLIEWFTKDEFATFNVMTMAWAYNCSANAITPLVRGWVKSGLVAVAYTGATGSKNYRSGRGQFASLLEAAKADPVARMAAVDYLMEKKGESRKAAETTLRIYLGK